MRVAEKNEQKNTWWQMCNVCGTLRIGNLDTKCPKNCQEESK